MEKSSFGPGQWLLKTVVNKERWTDSEEQKSLIEALIQPKISARVENTHGGAEWYAQRRARNAGLTSISNTLLGVIALCPPVKERVATFMENRSHALQQSASDIGQPHIGRAPAENVAYERTYIEYYFKTIHIYMTLLDKECFLQRYQQREQQHESWQALLNMVLALGSIMSGSQLRYPTYIRRAYKYVHCDISGSCRLEDIQAVLLLGLHYFASEGSPSIACDIYSVGRQMAMSLQIHTDSNPLTHFSQTKAVDCDDKLLEARRKTWWCLYCSDVWSCAVQGKISYHRWEDNAGDLRFPSYPSSLDWQTTLLYAGIEICFVFNHIQKFLARGDFPSPEDVRTALLQLESCFSKLYLSEEHVKAEERQQFADCLEDFKLQYNSCRVFLARCLIEHVLIAAREGRKMLSEDHWKILDLGFSVADEAINVILPLWHWTMASTRLCTTYIKQSCCIVLLALAIQRNQQIHYPCGNGSQDVRLQAWRATMMRVLDRMLESQPMAQDEYTLSVIYAIYEALSAPSED